MTTATTPAAVAELWEAMKAAGLSVPAEERAAVVPLWEAVRESEKLRIICIDVQQSKCNTRDTSPKERLMTPAPFVSYVRVSTRKQAASGLGLEAQREAVQRHVEISGGAVAREFTETESGKKANRPQLEKALAFAKRNGATVIVAKLDRLSRNVAFLSTLMESGVDFVATDNPAANRFTLHVLAAVAEHEREMISRRTKEALAQAKARGTALGSAKPGHWDGREDRRREGQAKGNRRSAEVRAAAAREEYADLLPTIRAMRGEGQSLRAIAAALNESGERTRRGAQFTASHIVRIIKRFDQKEEAQ
ncbi:MAG: recombinase family protein [Sumerlaeia bacterium]